MTLPTFVSAASVLAGLFPRVADLTELARAAAPLLGSVEVLAICLLLWFIFDRLVPAKAQPLAKSPTRAEPSLVLILLTKHLQPTPKAEAKAKQVHDSCFRLSIHRVFFLLGEELTPESFISNGVTIPRQIASDALNWAQRATEVAGLKIEQRRNKLQPRAFTTIQCQRYAAALNIPLDTNTSDRLIKMGVIDVLIDDFTDRSYWIFAIDYPGCAADQKIPTHISKLTGQASE